MVSHALHFIRCAARVSPQLFVTKTIVAKLAHIMVVPPQTATSSGGAGATTPPPPPAAADVTPVAAATAAKKKKKDAKSATGSGSGSGVSLPITHAIQLLQTTELSDSSADAESADTKSSRASTPTAEFTAPTDEAIRSLALRAIHELCIQINSPGDVERPAGRVIAMKLIEAGLIEPLLSRCESTALNRSLSIECLALLAERVEGRRAIQASSQAMRAIFHVLATEKSDGAVVSGLAFLVSRLCVSPDWIKLIDSLPITAPPSPASEKTVEQTVPTASVVVCDILNVAWQWAQAALKALGKRWSGTDTERSTAVLLSRSLMLINAMTITASKKHHKRVLSLSGLLETVLLNVDHWWMDVSKACLGIIYNLTSIKTSPATYQSNISSVVSKIESLAGGSGGGAEHQHKKWLKRMIDLFLSENGLDATESMVERGRLILEVVLNLSDHHSGFRGSLTDYLSSPNSGASGGGGSSRYPLVRMIEEMRNDRSSGDEEPFQFPSPVLTAPNYQAGTKPPPTTTAASADSKSGGGGANASPNALAIAQALKRMTDHKIVAPKNAAPAAAADSNACAHCTKRWVDSLPAFKACGGCRSVWYCGVDCQKSHWKLYHKAQCKRSTTS